MGLGRTGGDDTTKCGGEGTGGSAVDSLAPARATHAAKRSWLAWVFKVGPDAPDSSETMMAHEKLLTWPVRIGAVITAFILGRLWGTTSFGGQLGWVLQYVGLILVSLLASNWTYIGFANAVIAVPWLVMLVPQEGTRWRWPFRVVHEINRKMGHGEAIVVWTIVSFTGFRSLVAQLVGVTSVVFLGMPLVNWLTRTIFFQGKNPNKADLHPERRIFFYAATILGLVVLGRVGRAQIGKLVPIFAAILVGTVLRTIRYFLRYRAVRKEAREEARDMAKKREDYRRLQRAYARRTDMWGPIAILIGLVVVVGYASVARARYDSTFKPAAVPAERCSTHADRGPARADVQMFLVADSQLHELGGQPFPGQLSLVDALVPVALRPVELDILSGAALAHFGAVYHQLADVREAHLKKPLLWAHLGDFADLACENELARVSDNLKARFGYKSLAGVAPGNHDKSFTGNFYFSPYWDEACASPRLEKSILEEKLEKAWSGAIKSAGGKMVRVTSGPLARVTGRGGALVTVTKLGTVGATTVRGKHRHDNDVIGVFLDTSDGDAFDFGIAGIFGAISDKQIETAISLVDETSPAKHDEEVRPFFVVFAHHPIDALTPRSGTRLNHFIDALSGRGDVLSVITAHTHIAEQHGHCADHRSVREITIGSTIDPPQEAALLSIGPDEDGELALSVRTLQAVARPDSTCGESSSPTADECEAIMADLAGQAACQPLFQRDDRELGPDCQVLESPESARARFAQAVRALPSDPSDVRAEQERRGTELFECICRGKRCATTEAARHLNDDAYTALLEDRLHNAQAAGQRPEAEKELSCLAWAASVVQAHKSAGMEMSDALRCAFEDSSIAGAKEFVVHLEAGSCR